MDSVAPNAEMILLDLTSILDQGDNPQVEFEQVLNEALVQCAEVKPEVEQRSNGKWRVCGITPTCFEHHTSSSLPLFVPDEAVQSRLKEKLKKYIRRQDNFLNLASLLIKSETFHQFHQTDPTTMDLPVVDLPRTEYGKPFIPPTDDSDAPLFSVSHQFPFVGICRILDANDIPQNLRLGMDIVMFDEINSRLYSSEMDFCRVFQRSFAPGEWSCIERAQYPLQEFYLRWAIKEAYTKALGKGMSLKFDSFQTKLDVAACRYGWSLWDHLERPRTPSSQTNEEVHRLWGTISKVNSVDTTESERWLLMFIPLPSCGKNGYACICFGPAENEKALCETSLSRLDTTLSELIQFHVAARETEKNGTVTNDKCA